MYIERMHKVIFVDWSDILSLVTDGIFHSLRCKLYIKYLSEVIARAFQIRSRLPIGWRKSYSLYIIFQIQAGAHSLIHVILMLLWCFELETERLVWISNSNIWSVKMLNNDIKAILVRKLQAVQIQTEMTMVATLTLITSVNKVT